MILDYKKFVLYLKKNLNLTPIVKVENIELEYTHPLLKNDKVELEVTNEVSSKVYKEEMWKEYYEAIIDKDEELAIKVLSMSSWGLNYNCKYKLPDNIDIPRYSDVTKLMLAVYTKSVIVLDYFLEKISVVDMIYEDLYSLLRMSVKIGSKEVFNLLLDWKILNDYKMHIELSSARISHMKSNDKFWQYLNEYIENHREDVNELQEFIDRKYAPEWFCDNWEYLLEINQYKHEN